MVQETSGPARPVVGGSSVHVGGPGVIACGVVRERLGLSLSEEGRWGPRYGFEGRLRNADGVGVEAVVA